LASGIPGGHRGKQQRRPNGRIERISEAKAIGRGLTRTGADNTNDGSGH
jgi:hypothetical protein